MATIIHCHCDMQEHHDTLFLEQDVTPLDCPKVYGHDIYQNAHDIKYGDDVHGEHNILDIAAVDTRKTPDDDDDIEIIICQDKISNDISFAVVSKWFVHDDIAKDKIILAASFEIKTKSKSKNEIEEYKETSAVTKNHNHFHEHNTTPDIHRRMKHLTSYAQSTSNYTKHVNFQEPNASKHVSLRSHKMVMECSKNIHRNEETVIQHSDWCGLNISYPELNPLTVSCNTKLDDRLVHVSYNNIPKQSNNPSAIYSKERHTQPLKSNSHVSSTESILIKSSTKIPYTNASSSKIVVGGKQVTILRRGCADIGYLEKSKVQEKIVYENKSNNKTDECSTKDSVQPWSDVDTGHGMRRLVHISRSHTNTKISTVGNTINYVHSSTSTISADDLITNPETNLDRKEGKKLKKRLQKKRKHQNKIKTKVPKSDMEIFQLQFETGQLRSMISPYKTESLRCMKFLECIHEGAFSHKYKASFQNKQVVLTVFDEDIAGGIAAVDMALMGSCYFIIGYSDCMTGPSGRLWFKSMYHGIGDLQKLLSRDKDRHVIGELQAQFIAAGVLIGVDFLHQNEIIHGNIKPSKVLINNLGYPVLTGFVKTVQPNLEGIQAFTASYVAPEYLRGKRTPAVDIFSVGCMAYEITTGWTPFDGETMEQTVSNIHATCRPPYDPKLFSLAGELFIDACLRKCKEERFCIGERRINLVADEWFSTLDWRDFRKQLIRSPILDALQLIQNQATLTWDEMLVPYKWGRVMDLLCPDTATFELCLE